MFITKNHNNKKANVKAIGNASLITLGTRGHSVEMAKPINYGVKR